MKWYPIQLSKCAFKIADGFVHKDNKQILSVADTYVRWSKNIPGQKEDYERNISSP